MVDLMEDLTAEERKDVVDAWVVSLADLEADPFDDVAFFPYRASSGRLVVGLKEDDLCLP